jgi:uncharacterized protein
LKDKTEQLRHLLSGFDRVGIAFSGGVDSSFLLRFALDVLGPANVVVLHARSCLQKKQERSKVTTWAERHGYLPAAIQQQVITIDPLSWDDFTANPVNRCYLCKKRLYRLFLDTLHQQGISVLLDGTNADDLRQGRAGRPGLQALEEFDICTPLADCGLDKKNIRSLSRKLKLDTADQPSSSCLATRIPHGMHITSERLQRIADLEQMLEKKGFTGCRVRLSKESEHTLFVQIQENSLFQLCYHSIKASLLGPLKKENVRKIYLDLEGR